MPITTREFRNGVHEDNTIGDDLGLLLRAVDKKTIFNQQHSYYSGHELAQEGVVKPQGCEYRKKDVGDGSGKGFNRTQNRIIVVVNRNAQTVATPATAYFWRHDGRINKLGTGFFTRAQSMRNM